jgi:hypothetical protein
MMRSAATEPAPAVGRLGGKLAGEGDTQLPRRLGQHPRATLLGAAVLLLCVVQAALAIQPPLLLALRDSELFRLLSGGALAALVAHQWLLYFARRRGWVTSKHLLRSHVTLGAVAPAMLMAHAPGPGYGFLFLLWMVFVMDLAIGLVPPASLTRVRTLRTVWLIAHIGVSAVLPLLIAYHVWVVLYYH